MRLQQFVLNSFMLGAILFLPTNALAEKPDVEQKTEALKELPAQAANPVQKQVNEKQEDAKGIVQENKPLKKEPAVLPVQAKPERTVKTLPEQASQTAKKAVQAVEKPVQSAVKPAKQISKKPLPEKVMDNPGEKKGLQDHPPAENKQPVQSEPVKPDQVIQAETPEKTAVQSEPIKQAEPVQPAAAEKSLSAVQPDVVTSESMVSTKVPSVQQSQKLHIKVNKNQPKETKKSNTQPPPVFGEPKQDEQPSGKKSVPNEKQAITQTTSNQIQGGSSKDRLKTGNGFVKYTEKWLDWENYWTLDHSQTYLSRMEEFSTQWMNAPPSQPPEQILFL
ncbi:hypothetical protein JOC78_000405 [Bacillus ectoiniformans]|uniref:hypothetical protein n=1 Tax=Bacillus ectoiniformans TaxID=1494429 RepID=UPI00195DA3AA|nr:hypothetical protein [Bacillus ectoiniformans]MBM7647484.1 hypothetical protein [Bacillus ectoiniformans]